MVDEAPAKVWSDQRDLPIHLGDSGDGFRIPGKEKWRLPDALAALIGFVATLSLVTLNLESGNAIQILVVGVVLTVVAVWALDKLPYRRPSLRSRFTWWLANLRPQIVSSHPVSKENPHR
ncbi:hypothetical protein FZI85_27630 [Mycobacterium sp. CBMA293]|uniref:Uncharacterized protein n=1 Tax=Mycolicibacterium sp. CBMA 213 TaxID=1968788 RepID=A0A1S6GKS5_9MYCO|nr:MULTISPECIES: hypothetical protein [unclassified Mycolicibacterium]MUL48367.1 hypothetical protein [Mycolicibacterium sp. CBMA 360]MUM34213.1 hypothetical protein [Mycolicibacterium sp. CBMA 361]AQS22464.1 hypothetical protein pCBMA213_2_00100 [Mycolicibacterium sp. CBMA 213]MUL62379.1 hypothetical protein [Mycolicibacterium sp. CBMA 335]MUM04515.1 hypothetical protein [Mycolicibacterium sp. CBMA 213]